MWRCGANNAELLFTITKVGSDGWQIKSNLSNGCLDNRDGQLVDCNPVEVYTCQAGNPDQLWTIWQYSHLQPDRSLVSEIVPRNPSGPTTFTYGTTKVLSIAGIPANGSPVQLWRSGANDNNQEIEWNCAPTSMP